MEPITAELMDEARKRDARGRKIATPERRAELLATFDGSGLTQRAFARREGVNFHTFVAWLQRRRSARTSSATAAALPPRTTKPPGKATSRKVASARTPCAAHTSWKRSVPGAP